MFKKKVISVLLAILITVCVAGTFCNAEALSLEDGRTLAFCDANNDKEVNIADLVRIKKYLLNSSEDIGVAADADQNGKITSDDFVLIRKVLLSSANMNPNNSLWTADYY